ncbi:MAG: DUF4129 domain-containing protein [Pseudomonadota bacterium]|nr:hypothetical protein [Pseudomonadales bacterium]MDY6922206.1 DUF4129 domain-containing protein [Pseudomonadota bacterium]
MDLDKISVEVRPRNPYEAMDLGFVMARRWLRPLLLLWLVPALPLMGLSYLVFHQQPLWALLFVWWLKPLLESIQLSYIAERLFDEQVDWRGHLRRAHRIALHQWFAKLVTQRLAFSRSFNMPVGELEGLAGTQRNQRLNTLHRGAGSPSLWLTLVGHSIEGLIVVAVFGGAWMLVPVEMDIDFSVETILNSPLLFPTITLAGFAAMTITAPFYVCAGFMLYINRRTWLEAWDIELTFRQLTRNHLARGQSLVMVLLLGALLAPLSGPAEARTQPAESRQAIAEILEGDEFHQLQQESSWRWKQEPPDPTTEDEQTLLQRLGEWLVDKLGDFGLGVDPGPVARILLAVLEVALWGLVVALVVYLVLRFRSVGLPRGSSPPADSPSPPSHLFGMALQQSSLPEDVVGEARALWQQQQYRAALSLLYRAALSFLVHERQLPLTSSHTEQECLQLCLQRESPQRGDYLRRLTRHWVILAYAHQPLTEAEFDALCADWCRFLQPEDTAS